jgi:anti-sigma factor RsiW
MANPVMMISGDLEDLAFDAALEEELAGFDASPEPPSLLLNIVAEMSRDPQFRAWMRSLGRQFALDTFSKIKSAVIEETPPPSPWMVRVIAPLLEDFKAGATAVAVEKLRPAATLLAVGAATVALVTGILIGGHKKSIYEQGRAAGRTGR